jgi:hypothetical protein
MRPTLLLYVTLFGALLAALGLLAANPEPPSKTEAANPANLRRPVLLELFTSEGCSSCPPADRLLDRFDRTQPVAGADLIVLSEHVDYWNRLGWTDPFSSPLFTQRQQDYVRRLHLDSAYTPQLVVDGQKDVVGSDESAARAAIRKAETRAKTAITLAARRAGADAKISLQVGEAPLGAEVYVALAAAHAESQVTRGENSGRTLQHVAVVRNILLVGKTNGQGTFFKDMMLPLKGGNGDWRAVAFLQDSGSGQILGAAESGL